jgi:FkbM family methyltransferase
MNQRLSLAIQALRGRLTRRLAGPRVRAMVVRTESGVFAVDPEDMVVGRALRRRGSYRAAELRGLLALVSPESRVLVVGAHIGAFAIPLARACRDVIAVEANPLTHELLAWNVALNSASNCRTLHLAASDGEGTVEFLLNRANSGGSKRIPKVADPAFYFDRPAVARVRAAPLDREIADRGFDLIVMDVEGSEYFALRGMQEILSGSRALVVEFLPHHLKNVAGVTVAEFLATVRPHFGRLTVPSRGLAVDGSRFAAVLEAMYAGNQGDDGLIFEKG